jgi:predicted nucleic acid-binding protein
MLYLDTSIWLDHYLERGKNGKQALQLMLKCIQKSIPILFSNYVQKELKYVGLSFEEINNLIHVVPRLKKVSVTKEEFKKAKRIAKQRSVPLGDVIHALVAQHYGAVLISRDKDFLKLKDIVKTKTPEELL